MSQREGRNSDTKRHRSRFDHDPSPKRSRRDEKVETEKPPLGSKVDILSHSDDIQRQRRRLQEAKPLEVLTKSDSKLESALESGDGSKKSDKKSNGRNEGAKKASDQQHKDRGDAGQAGRTFHHREPTERGWWKDSREQQRDRSNRTAATDSRRKDEKVKGQGEDDNVWHHDRYFEMRSDRKSFARMRPAFREQKHHPDSMKAEKVAAHPQKPNRSNRPASESVKKNGREGNNYQNFDKVERPLARERETRYGGSYRKDGFTARPGTGGVVEKWKHDLFDDASRSPPPKTDEDQIAKVEALLAS